ncbi:MAG TPA: class I SAM-dependent methyltransferase [Solirubrobacteraceae bacterium]|nr:class I SAM-dependent methyltransferase [Solirubrobacteraceae bacterium]
MAREPSTDLEILQRLAQPAGKDVVDIGCGGGALVRELARLGARPIGVEISPEQLAPALAAGSEAGGRYLVGRAEQLPLPERSVDVAVFMRSLHHVPIPGMLPALSEARRVLRDDGLVYVAEPLPEGDFFALTSLVEDELEVRAAAQRAVADAGQAGLRGVTTLDYEVSFCLADVGAFLKRLVSVDPDRAATFAAREAEITATFGEMGTAGDAPGERCFIQPMRVDVLGGSLTRADR